MALRPVEPGAVQSEMSTDSTPRTPLLPNCSGAMLRQNCSCEMLVSAHSVSMWITWPWVVGRSRRKKNCTPFIHSTFGARRCKLARLGSAATRLALIIGAMRSSGSAAT